MRILIILACLLAAIIGGSVFGFWKLNQTCSLAFEQVPQPTVEIRPSSPVPIDGASSSTRPNNHDWTTNFWCEIKATDVALALFTSFLVLVGVGQAYWLYAAVYGSTKQHIAVNRAFVFLRFFSYVATGSQKDVEFWRITPVFENSGNTPTKHMVSFHSAELRDKALPEDFTFPDTPFPTGRPVNLCHDFIGPHAQLNCGPYILSIADILAIQKGTKKFYMWGWLDYSDIFDTTKRHRTEYCYQLAVLLDPKNPNNVALGAGLHGQHNAVDDQCYRNPKPYVPPAA